MNSDALAARIENLLGSSQSSGAGDFPSQRPPPIPDHEIIAPIGRGSYGEVWLARSVTGALRAVKVVWRSRFASERPYEREFRGIVQFEPISRSHPGVVNVLHVGRDDAAGCFFYVMELADAAGNPKTEIREPKEIRKPNAEETGRPAGFRASGVGLPSEFDIRNSDFYSPRTLASDLKSRGRLPVTEAVSLGVQLAGALGHLHRHGLVHRDVKPSNVIFVAGQPKLADIGLVASLNEEQSFVGTEGYIPPEGPGSERADLFSLGRLLYETATGKNRENFPALPEDLDRWPASERKGLIELNEVLVRACAPEAKKRHSNAADLAGDLNLILAGRSVRRAYRIERRLRRATLISGIALALVIATTFSNWLQHRQRELSEARARRETTLRQRAEAAERESQLQLYAALLEQVRGTVRSGEVGQRFRAFDALRRAAAITNTAELRREAFAALAVPDLRFERELPLDTDVASVSLDPAFERMAFFRGKKPVEIRAVSDGRLLATLPASTNWLVSPGEWSPDGRFFAVPRDHPGRGGAQADLEVWEVATTNRVLLLHGVQWGAMSFHPRLPRLMAAESRNSFAIWNLEDGRQVRHFELPGTVRCLRFAPDGERFAAIHGQAAPGWVVSVRDLTNGLVLASNVFLLTAPTVCAWHPDGSWLAVPESSGAVYSVDSRAGNWRILGRHKAEARRVQFSRDGAYLISGGWDNEILCWDARTLRHAFTTGLDSYLGQFRADGRALVVQVPSGLRLYGFERPGAHREFTDPIGPRLRHAAFSPDGRWLAASTDIRAGVWDLSQEERGSLAEYAGVLADDAYDTFLHFTPDGRELFASRARPGDEAAYRWRITPTRESGKPRLERLPLFKPSKFGFVSLMSTSVVMTSAQGTQLLAPDEVESGKEAWTRTHSGMNRASPDGRWVGILGSFSPSLYVHRLPDLERVAKLTHPNNIGFFEFSPLGDEVALFSSGGVSFWSTTTWKQTRMLTNFTSLLYAPDARTLWLHKNLRAAGLYDARTLEPRLLLPTGMVPMAASPDGRHLAVSVDAQRLQVWDLAEVRARLRELGLDWADQ